MSGANVNILCYWNGSMIYGPEGVDYTAGKRKVIQVFCTITFVEVLDKIHAITGWDNDNSRIKISGRLLTQSSPRHFVAIPINNDESLAILFDMLQHGGIRCVELYLENERVCGTFRQPPPLMSCLNHSVTPCGSDGGERPLHVGPHAEAEPVLATEILGHESFISRQSSSQSREDFPAMPFREAGITDTAVVGHDDIALPEYMIPLGGVDPGPNDMSVLKDQRNHRSSDLWENKIGAKHSVLRVRSGHVWTPHPLLHQYIMDAGFLGLLWIEKIPIDQALMTALVERWREETHTFHLRVGEMTITLQDVALLLGLPVDGEAVIGYYGGDWAGLCEVELGVRPGVNDLEGGSLHLKWLQENFSSLPDEAGEVMVKRYAKAWLLCVIGYVLCPTKTGDKISLSYLKLLRDLNKVRNYSWGSAVLSKLYRGLCKASKRGVKEFAGCGLLLQLWSWERLHIGRPNPLVVERHGDGGNEVANDTVLHPDIVNNAYARPPYGFRWKRRRFVENPHGNLHYYRVELDLQKENEVQWQPYKNILEADISRLCVEGHIVWRARVPLICFDVVEWHFPDRVLRQFGLMQKIPEPCDTKPQLHAIDKRGKPNKNWKVEHARYLDKWNHRLDYVVNVEPVEISAHKEYLTTYMSWYHNITRRLVAWPNILNQSNPSLQYHGNSGSWHRLVETLKAIAQLCSSTLIESADDRAANVALTNIHSLSLSALEDVSENGSVGKTPRFSSRASQALDPLSQEGIVNPSRNRQRHTSHGGQFTGTRGLLHEFSFKFAELSMCLPLLWLSVSLAGQL